MPPGLSVYEPRITREGDTTIFTYNVKADFSSWDATSGIKYTAQNDASAIANTTAQSIDALLMYYGATPQTVITSTSSITKDTEYELAVIASQPKYVVIPLDTTKIKKSLTEWKLLLTNGDPSKTPLVWIEENPAIGKVDKLKASENWEKGVYQASGFRIGGLIANKANKVVIAGCVDNFDDGGVIAGTTEEDATRLRSIATVLADGSDLSGDRYTSTINFYSGALAEMILSNLTTPAADATWKDASAVPVIKLWMMTNKPALRIVYQWAE
jgi:hypothetical protein